MKTQDVSLVTAPSGRVLKLRVIDVGHNHKCVGQVIGSNGRVVAETEPNLSNETALDQARTLTEVL